MRATATSCAASPAERSPPLPAAQPWHHAGPPQQPILAGANSWLYVPLLHASTGDLAADTLAAWRAAPQAMPWWDEARATLAAAPPQSPELLIEALRQHPAPHGAAAAAALTAARASLPRPTQVHLGWACRQLAEPTGYIPAAPQEVLLQIYGGLALAAALDQHSNRFRVPPLAPVAAPPLAHPRPAPAAPSTGAVVPVPDSDEERAFTGEGPPSPTPSTISDDRSQLDRPEHTPPPAAASAIPARAWAWLDSLDLAAELRRPCAVTRSPPAFLRAHLSRAFLVPMRILTQSRATQLQQQRAWTLFLLIPRLLLHRSPDRGAEGRAALLQRAAHFQAGAWENLYGAIPPAAPRPASPAPVNPQTRRHAQACAQVRQGNLSRARHTLTNPALAPGTPATLAALRDPDRRPPQLRRPIPDHLTRPLPAPPLRLTPAEIGDALRTAKRGAAPGLSGSTMDHYKVLLEDEEAFAHLTAMVNKLANADVPAPVLEALARARLTALTKPGGGIRGIATGEAFRRLTSRVLARHFATQFDLATRPFQFALQTRAGTDALATILRYCTDANPAATVVCLDGRSAYDTVSRAAVLAKVHECTPALLPYVKAFYGAQSSYSWFDNQGTVHDIVQGEGLEQGDSLAPALFALAQHEALVHASRTLPAGDRLYAYLDDICVLTTRDHARHAYDVVSRAIEGHAGIASNVGKTRVYHQDPGPPPQA